MLRRMKEMIQEVTWMRMALQSSITTIMMAIIHARVCISHIITLPGSVLVSATMIRGIGIRSGIHGTADGVIRDIGMAHIGRIRIMDMERGGQRTTRGITEVVTFFAQVFIGHEELERLVRTHPVTEHLL